MITGSFNGKNDNGLVIDTFSYWLVFVGGKNGKD